MDYCRPKLASVPALCYSESRNAHLTPAPLLFSSQRRAGVSIHALVSLKISISALFLAQAPGINAFLHSPMELFMALAAPSLTHLQLLEAESIHILREVASEFERPVMLLFHR